jgi:hypothetical protein
VLKRSLALVVALGGLTGLPACTSGQAAAPPYTPANVAGQSELQFQVGTANLNGTPGLNTVVTFRQGNGLSAVLTDVPTINLPFTNTAPASAAGVDSGTTTISGRQQAPSATQAPPATTFGTTVGAFAYGFLAVNSTQTGANNSVFYPTSNRMPYYAGTRRAYYVGPGNSYVPDFKDGSLGTAFNGYPSGFTTFALAPVAGAYSLNVAIPGSNVSVPSITATTALTSTALLGTIAAPTYTSDGAGGGTVGVVVPPGVSETLVFITDTTAGAYYTLVVRGTGAQSATLASNLGTITGGVAGPSIPVGHGVRAIAVGFDYPAVEAVPVGANPPQAPVINNAGTPCSGSGTSWTCTGQADLTVSGETTATE